MSLYIQLIYFSSFELGMRMAVGYERAAGMRDGGLHGDSIEGTRVAVGMTQIGWDSIR